MVARVLKYPNVDARTVGESSPQHLSPLSDRTRSHIVARLAAETAPLHLMGVPNPVEAAGIALDPL